MIFISYAREDAAAAQRLWRELSDARLPCLIDPPLPHGDAFWRDRLARQMAGCSLMVALQSPHADASPWVQQERRGFGGARCSVRLADGAAAVLQYEPAAAPHDALAMIERLWRGPRGGSAPPTDASASPAGESAAPAERIALAQRARAQFDAWCSAPRPDVRPVFDGPRAWLADGRIELHREPGAPHTPDAFYLAREPVSNVLYREFAEANGIDAPPTWQRADFAAPHAPVTGITWYEASACAAWFGGELPSEAAWAWAAQSGRRARRYATATGELAPALAHHGAAFARGAPQPATAHPPNAAGLHGLCGNTWDWCADAWGPHRAIRGGGWMDDAAFCSVAARYRNAPIDRDACVGLRIALRAPQ